MVGTPTRTARSGSAAPPARSPKLRPTPRQAPPAPSGTARSSRAVYEALETRCLFVSSLPTTDEQLMIELINRARANPAQYAQDFFLQVPLTDASPRPPVAANGFLTSSARKHAAEMAINDYFGSVSPLTGKGPNQIVRDEGYPLSSQFPTTPGLNNVESIT